METNETGVRKERVELILTYYVTPENPEKGTFGNQPVQPNAMDELSLSVYFDDDTPGIPDVLREKDLQVQLTGPADALEAFGTYLVALARMQSANPHPHDHFEDLRSENGGKVHLIVERA